jgi:hypothetical protein
MQYITSFIEYFYPSANEAPRVLSVTSESSTPLRKLSTEINNFNRETLKKVPETKTYNYQDNELKRLLGEKFKNVIGETNE